MAATFKNARQAIGTSYSTIYTCPSSTTAILLSCLISNVDGANAADISAQYLDSSAANAATRIVHTVSIAADTAVNILGGKVVLEAGDAFQLLASATGDLEASLHILELT